MAEDAIEVEEPAPRRALPWWLAMIVGRRPAWTIVRLVLWVVGILFVFKIAAAPVRVRGLSMMPTFQSDTLHIINKLAYRRADPQRGDVVAVRLAGDKVLFLKRIVGLPGERIAQIKGRIFVNGNLIEEPWIHRDYFSKRGLSSSKESVLSEDEYFVAGDNREISDFGKVKRDAILGRLWR